MGELDWRERLFGDVLWRCDQYDAAAGTFASVGTRAALAACGAGERGGGAEGEPAALVVYFSSGAGELAGRLEAAAERLAGRLAVVQVAADGSEAALRGRPWWALPLASTALQRRLMRRYGVPRGLDEVVVRGRPARTALLADPAVRRFPWPPPALPALLASAPLVRCADLAPAPPALAAGQASVTVFYFTAHWCPPCRALTPLVCGAVQTARARWPRYSDTALVVVSSDRSEESYRRSLRSVTASEAVGLAWGAAEAREGVAAALGVSGLPAVVLLGRGGELLTRRGRRAVSRDPLARNFPWSKRSWFVLTEYSLRLLDTRPAIVLFVEDTPEELEFAESVLEPAGKLCRRAARGGGDGSGGDTSSDEEGDERVLVACGAGGGAAERLRRRAGLDDAVPLLAGVHLAAARLQLLRYGALITRASAEHFAAAFLRALRDPEPPAPPAPPDT